MMRSVFLFVTTALLAVPSAFALEAATTGSQATQATVGVINSKVDITNNFINSIMKCNAARKFYAPSDAKKDADGCVGVGDYDLNMASGNNVNFANGRVYATQGASSNWGGLFYGPADYGGVYGQAGIYGVYGYATGNGYGVVGNATNNSGGIGGYFSGGNSGVRGYGPTFGLYGNSASYGVYGYSPSNYAVYGESSSGYGVRGASSSSWGGVFTGSYYGVYGSGSSYGVYSNGPLCINGSCITSWGQASRFGGTYTYNTDGWCYSANPQTGYCSCPSGYGNYFGTGGFSHLNLYICQK